LKRKKGYHLPLFNYRILELPVEKHLKRFKKKDY
jgi:hypothetical protein